MRTLVTGATGLVGSWVAKALLDRGHAVRALVRDESRLPKMLAGLVEPVRGDVVDPSSLERAAAGVEVIFHAAGVPEQAVRDVSLFDRVNRQGTVNVLEAAAKAGVRRVVHTSTMDVFVTPPPGGTLTEGPLDAAPKPTPYERSKVEAERAGRARAAAGQDVVFINPAAIYGPSHAPTMLTATLARLLRGEVPMLPPGGMSVTYVESLAAAHLAAAERAPSGAGYLVADAHLSPRELAALVAREVEGVKVPAAGPAWLMKLVAASTTPVLVALGRAALLDPGQLHWLLNDTRVDASKARRELGFVPTPLDEGVRRTVAALRAQG